MIETLTRKPVTDSPEPPDPPATDSRPRRRSVIIPSIMHCAATTSTHFDNCWTIHHSFMSRIIGEFESAQTTHVNSRLYRQWLDTHPESFTDGIPPHIQFGGCIVASPEGDPEFYNRWVAYAKKAFCC